jgi:hypothetical protein
MPKKIRFIVFVSFWVVAVWLLSFFIPYLFDRMDQAGQFGDMFGSSNALFTGLSTVGLIVTILLQIDANKEYERGKRFDTLLSLTMDLKNDMERFRYLGKRGYDAFHFLRDNLAYGVSISREHFKYPLIMLGSLTTLTTKVRESGLNKNDKELLNEKLQLLYMSYLLNLVESMKKLPDTNFVNEIKVVIGEMETEFKKSKWDVDL